MAYFWNMSGFGLLAIAVAGFAVLIVMARRDIREAYSRITSSGARNVNTGGINTEYAEYGDGYPILVVHGAMGGFDQGLWLSHNFGLTGYRVICVSRFGYLGSPLPDNATLDSQADTFASLLDVLGIQQAAVLAISAGSTSAIRFAARHPQRISCLLLACPDAPGKVPINVPPRFIFNTLLRSDFVYWVLVKFFRKNLQYSTGLVPRGYPLTPEYQSRVDAVQWADLPVSRRMDGMIFESFTTLDDYLASVTEASPYPLSRIMTPTLIIHALDDPITIAENIRALATALPDAKLISLPDGGHLMFGHTEEVRASIAGFLKSHIPPVSGRQDR